MPPTDSREREAFEAHMLKMNACTRLHRQREQLGGHYRTTTVQRAWELWQAALSAAPQSDGWISVDERLPAHEQEVICTGFEGNDPAKKRWQDFAVFHSDGTFYDREIGDELYPPTHWREMFAHPTTKTQGEEA